MRREVPASVRREMSVWGAVPEVLSAAGPGGAAAGEEGDGSPGGCGSCKGRERGGRAPLAGPLQPVLVLVNGFLRHSGVVLAAI